MWKQNTATSRVEVLSFLTHPPHNTELPSIKKRKTRVLRHTISIATKPSRSASTSALSKSQPPEWWIINNPSRHPRILAATICTQETSIKTNNAKRLSLYHLCHIHPRHRHRFHTWGKRHHKNNVTKGYYRSLILHFISLMTVLCLPRVKAFQRNNRMFWVGLRTSFA